MYHIYNAQLSGETLGGLILALNLSFIIYCVTLGNKLHSLGSCGLFVGKMGIRAALMTQSYLEDS